MGAARDHGLIDVWCREPCHSYSYSRRRSFTSLAEMTVGVGSGWCGCGLADVGVAGAGTASPALAQEPMEDTVALGEDPAQLGPLPASVHAHPSVPLTAALPQCAAIVHHGGAGTCLAALTAGAPQVIIPQGADQFPTPIRSSRADALCAARPSPKNCGPPFARRSSALWTARSRKCARNRRDAAASCCGGVAAYAGLPLNCPPSAESLVQCQRS
jgi:EryCIII-like glycosyltransferase